MSNSFGVARPSGRTATASPPQISLAPLAPNRRQRRNVRSLGRPSVSASQPSIGRMQKRLPTVRPPTAMRLGQRAVRAEVGVERHLDAERRQAAKEVFRGLQTRYRGECRHIPSFRTAAGASPADEDIVAAKDGI